MEQAERQAFKQKAMIRNRRMRKMQELMEQGDYFSASSLETRAPSLFHDYIGRHKHLSNPKYHNSSSAPSANPMGSRDLCNGAKSEEGEGRRMGSTARTVGGRMVNGDGEDVPVCLQPGQWREEKGGQALADFLLHSMDKRENRLRRQRENSDYALATPESESGSENDEIEGEEEEKELPGDELERLRREFLRLMQDRFLDVMDAEYFDYQESEHLSRDLSISGFIDNFCFLKCLLYV
jgi:hypothetical protein